MIHEHVPEEVVRAGRELVDTVNKVGERCVGVVFVVVFEHTNRIFALFDTGMRPVGGSDPGRAILEDAAVALLDRLEEEGPQTPEPSN